MRAAIEQARSFAAGDLDVGDAIGRRGGDAGAAARDAPDPAARAAAYAAEQAAAVARAISSLPALGENPSGTLGPGRLTLGPVGHAIREIQRLLAERGSVG